MKVWRSRTASSIARRFEAKKEGGEEMEDEQKLLRTRICVSDISELPQEQEVDMQSSDKDHWIQEQFSVLIGLNDLDGYGGQEVYDEESDDEESYFGSESASSSSSESLSSASSSSSFSSSSSTSSWEDPTFATEESDSRMHSRFRGVFMCCDGQQSLASIGSSVDRELLERKMALKRHEVVRIPTEIYSKTPIGQVFRKKCHSEVALDKVYALTPEPSDISIHTYSEASFVTKESNEKYSSPYVRGLMTKESLLPSGNAPYHLSINTGMNTDQEKSRDTIASDLLAGWDLRGKGMSQSDGKTGEIQSSVAAFEMGCSLDDSLLSTLDANSLLSTVESNQRTNEKEGCGESLTKSEGVYSSSSPLFEFASGGSAIEVEPEIHVNKTCDATAADTKAKQNDRTDLYSGRVSSDVLDVLNDLAEDEGQGEPLEFLEVELVPTPFTPPPQEAVDETVEKQHRVRSFNFGLSKSRVLKQFSKKLLRRKKKEDSVASTEPSREDDVRSQELSIPPVLAIPSEINCQ